MFRTRLCQLSSIISQNYTPLLSQTQPENYKLQRAQKSTQTQIAEFLFTHSQTHPKPKNISVYIDISCAIYAKRLKGINHCRTKTSLAAITPSPISLPSIGHLRSPTLTFHAYLITIFPSIKWVQKMVSESIIFYTLLIKGQTKTILCESWCELGGRELTPWWPRR